MAYNSTNLDVELICLDEDLDEVQETMHEKESQEYKETTELIEKFREVQHIRARNNGKWIFGIPNSPPPPLIVSVKSLAKKKSNNIKFVPESQSNGLTLQRLRVSPTIDQQNGHNIQAAQAGTYHRFPMQTGTSNANLNPNRFSNAGLNHVTMTPTSSSVTQISTSSGSRIRLPNGQELSVSQFQSLLNQNHVQSNQNNIRTALLFDATTGTFFVPYSTTFQTQVVGHNSTYMSSTTDANIPIITSVSGSIPGRPDVTVTDTTSCIQNRTPLTQRGGEGITITSLTRGMVPIPIIPTSQHQPHLQPNIQRPTQPRTKTIPRMLIRPQQLSKTPGCTSASKFSIAAFRSQEPTQKVFGAGARTRPAAPSIIGSSGWKPRTCTGAATAQAEEPITKVNGRTTQAKETMTKVTGRIQAKPPTSKSSEITHAKEPMSRVAGRFQAKPPTSKANEITQAKEPMSRVAGWIQTKARKSNPSHSDITQAKEPVSKFSSSGWIMPTSKVSNGTTAQIKTPSPEVNNEDTQETTIVDLTTEQDRKNDNNCDIADDTNKTYPSLIVYARPILGKKLGRSEMNQARASLDARVKALVQLNPAKLTEKLMQFGLLRVEHHCENHVTSAGLPVAYKLGMYSSADKMPQSGGYTWVADCCMNKQISVFQGSIFQGAPYPPVTMLKLMYHWCCQTSASLVIGWVKVTNLYLKNFYTLLRSCCVAGLNEFCPVMGGDQKYVEIGIVTLSYNPLDGPTVKLEFLGVFDPSAKIVRIRLLNPQGNNLKSSKSHRLSEFLSPVKQWVHKSSCILIDDTIDKQMIAELGFRSVIQCKSGVVASVRPGQPNPPSNINIRNYLKGMLAKMFQNSIHVLSKSLVQLFLDELSWRELWGRTSAEAFDNITNHLTVMTKMDSSESDNLFARLTKISINPFAERCKSDNTTERIGIDSLPDSIRNAGQVIQNRSSTHTASKSNPDPVSTNRPQDILHIPKYGPVKRKSIELERSELRDYFNVTPKTVSLFKHYFTSCSGKYVSRQEIKDFPSNLKCTMCSETFQTRAEVIPHIYRHIMDGGRRITQKHNCPYCLKHHSNMKDMEAHISDIHLLDNCKYPCVICEEKFSTLEPLVLHMWEKHCKSEMPYKCGICDHRSSRYSDVVDHFNDAHAASNSVLCPYCLKVLVCSSVPCINQVVEHIQNHVETTRRRKCQRCCLVFLTETDYKAHIYEGAHKKGFSTYPEGGIVTPIKFSYNLSMPAPPPVNRDCFDSDQPFKREKPLEVMKKTPATKKGSSKFRLKPILDEDLDSTANRNFHDYTFYLPPGEDETNSYSCTECHQSISTNDHFPGLMICVRCHVSTSCQPTISSHNQNVHPIGSDLPTQNNSCLDVRPIEDMEGPMSCVCGTRSSRAEDLMIHLQECGKSAVISV